METYLFSQYNSKVPGLHIETATIHEDFSAHQHDFSELVVILSGRAVHSIENRNYRISSGDVYVLTGNTVHEFSNVEDLEICNIMFDPLLPLNINPGLASISGYQALFAIEPLLRPEGMEQHRFSLSPIQLSCVREMILLLYVEYQHLDSRKERKELILNLFGSLCYYLSIKKEENIGLYGNNTTARAGKAAAFIHSHFSETLTIDEIAGSADISVRHLSRIFEKTYGLSPGNYLRNVRLNEACKMLSHSSENVTAIAYSCGFSDGNYFSRLFHSVYHCTPREYRKAVE